jgi:hypothetical protein
MLILLMFLHHFALAPRALHHLISAHVYANMGRSRRAKIRDWAEQVQGVFRGPQASNCEDTNIVVRKTSPHASHQ